MIPEYVKIKNNELPDTPGVYLMKDEKGTIIYVGKATSLKRRVSSYFQRPHDARIQQMVSEIRSIDYIQKPTAIEALILEANLIKFHWPHFNVKEKDNKSFLYLVVTNEDFPKPKLIRGTDLEDDASKKYKAVFGPYTSGTPLDKPREIYTLLTMLDTATWGPAGVERSKEQGRFYFRYCGPEKVWTGRKYVTTFDGATNLEELQERLRTSLMVRRLKSDVLTELPAKRRQIVVLGEQADEDGFPLDESGDYQEQVDNLRKSGKVAFEEISGLRHEQALRKLPKCIEYLTETLENNNEKVVVFAHHKDVIAELETALAPFGLVKIDGSTPVGERGGIVDAFQNGSARVFLGSIGAAGVGLTLTAASRVVFVELDWTPKAMNQAEDRCHRIGQKDTVLVQHLVIDGTLDAKIAKMLVRKQDVADSALDRTMAIEAPAPAPAPAILDDIAFTSCTCLAAPDGSNGHASWCDMFMQIPAMTLIDATPAAPIVSRETSSKSALTEAEITKIHAALRTLAEACDGANSKDGSGFNKMDAAFGHGLAMRETLTEKQALAARRMLRKYKRQIGEV
jgi:hypothetical protein